MESSELAAIASNALRDQQREILAQEQAQWEAISSPQVGKTQAIKSPSNEHECLFLE